MDTVSYMLGKRAGGGTMIETDPIFSSSPASGITSNDISNWNGKSDFSGNYNDLTNKPDIPEDIQYTIMPTASVDNLGKIVQYTGTTDSTYTNGYFYKCVSDGESTPTYSWENIEVQAGGGGGSSYTAGTNIEITNDNIINNKIPYIERYRNDIWEALILGTGTFSGNYARGIGIGKDVTIGESCVALGNSAQAINYSVAIGQSSKATYSNTVAIGLGAQCKDQKTVAIGASATANNAQGIAIGYYATTTKVQQCVIGSSSASINELGIYTSNGYKIIATQDFVTNYLTTVTGYDNTKTQVLKNVNGTLTWVDE